MNNRRSILILILFLAALFLLAHASSRPQILNVQELNLAESDPQEIISNIFLSLMGLGLLLALLGLIFGGRKAPKKRKRNEGYPLTIGAVMVLIGVLVFIGTIIYAVNKADDIEQLPPMPMPPPSSDNQLMPEGYEIPEFETDQELRPFKPWPWQIPVALTLGLITLIVLRWYGKQDDEEIKDPTPVYDHVEEHLSALEDAIAVSLAELENEPDPRKAIIACYQEFQRLLQEQGWPKPAHYTAEEYLREGLRRFPLPQKSVRTLTALFQLARFSTHPVSSEDKARTIASLEELRTSLREHQEKKQNPA